MSTAALAAAALLAGAVGATIRAFLVARFDTTAVVNVPGSLLLGLLVGAQASADLLVVAGIGFLGALTTFSTWMVDASGRPRHCLRAIAGQLFGGLSAAAAGLALGGMVPALG